MEIQIEGPDFARIDERTSEVNPKHAPNALKQGLRKLSVIDVFSVRSFAAGTIAISEAWVGIETSIFVYNSGR